MAHLTLANYNPRGDQNQVFYRSGGPAGHEGKSLVAKGHLQVRRHMQDILQTPLWDIEV